MFCCPDGISRKVDRPPIEIRIVERPEQNFKSDRSKNPINIKEFD